MHPLVFASFGSSEDPLAGLQQCAQGRYLRSYLGDLGAKSVLVEPKYFDRDYLSEFQAFYSTSAADYSNVCRRAHFFGIDVSRELFSQAVGGDDEALTALRAGYFGFIVIRPIPAAQLGRTVLRWYPDSEDQLPRVHEPSRDYVCHVSGIELPVKGLAWQQQDTGVGACATVALWSMLHSSAFDDRHVVPTTADVTRKAHGAGLSAKRMFPSDGLTLPQLVGTLRDSGFAPLVIAEQSKPGKSIGFTKNHFCTSIASFIRSGYPVLVGGEMVLGKDEDGKPISIGKHAVCAVGFRQATGGKAPPGELQFEDATTKYLYLHDDNLGPAARFEIETDDNVVHLKYSPPHPHTGDSSPVSLRGRPSFVPTVMLAAAHEDVRLSPDQLHSRSVQIGAILMELGGQAFGLTASSRITSLARYVSKEIATVLNALRAPPKVLAATRLALIEQVPPMSLHVGIVRFGEAASPILDILYDTTDSPSSERAFCTVVYDPNAVRYVELINRPDVFDLGVMVPAF